MFLEEDFKLYIIAGFSYNIELKNKLFCLLKW